MNDQRQRLVRPGELLAMAPARLHQGPAGFFWMLGSGLKPNKREGETELVYIRGELEHHADDFACAESYEGIRGKMGDALVGRHIDNEGKPYEEGPPKRIIACIDSPGGVVSGLNECVAALQKLVVANPKIEFAAYVDEMAASAAFALACAFPEILCPPAAILGSIGVISTMISQARRNAKDGYDVRLITSGARKADGHLHAPITDAALAAETGRVEKLALAFFKLASRARGVPVAKVESLQAGIFLGPDAVRRGLADAVMSFDDVLLGERSGDTVNNRVARLTGGNQTDRRVTESTMPIALKALIKRTEAKLAGEKDPKKLAALVSSLEAYKKTVKHMEHETREEGDDEDDDEEEDEGEDDDEEDEEEEAASSKTPMKGKGKASSEEEDEEEASSEEEEAKAALAAVRRLTGMKGNAALGALEGAFSAVATVAADVKKLKAEQKAGAKATLIAGARQSGQITKAEAAFLKDQPLATVKGFVALREKAGLVVTAEENLHKPKHAAPGTEESLSDEARAQIDAAVANFPGADKKAFRATLVKAHLEAHDKQIKAAQSGAGRY